MGNINWKDKCWVTTIYLVNDENKVLLTWNKNLQTWIPVGGHIDLGETPEEAISREVAEETGFDFKILSPNNNKSSNVKILSNHWVQVENVPHHNKHMNFVFFGKCTTWDSNTKTTDEDEKLKWFSKEELENEQGMLESVKASSLYALTLN